MLAGVGGCVALHAQSIFIHRGVCMYIYMVWGGWGVVASMTCIQAFVRVLWFGRE